MTTDDYCWLSVWRHKKIFYQGKLNLQISIDRQLTRLIKALSELPKQVEKVETVGVFLLLYFKSTNACLVFYYKADVPFISTVLNKFIYEVLLGDLVKTPLGLAKVLKLKCPLLNYYKTPINQLCHRYNTKSLFT